MCHRVAKAHLSESSLGLGEGGLFNSIVQSELLENIYILQIHTFPLSTFFKHFPL
jgi:hypothetical protein